MQFMISRQFRWAVASLIWGKNWRANSSTWGTHGAIFLGPAFTNPLDGLRHAPFRFRAHGHRNRCSLVDAAVHLPFHLLPFGNDLGNGRRKFMRRNESISQGLGLGHRYVGAQIVLQRLDEDVVYILVLPVARRQYTHQSSHSHYTYLPFVCRASVVRCCSLK